VKCSAVKGVKSGCAVKSVYGSEVKWSGSEVEVK